MKKKISIFLALLIFASAFSACGKDTGEGGSFTVPLDNDPVYLDPQIASDKGARMIINNCFEGLVRLDSDGDIVCGVADDWKISSDGLVYTFTLRKDAKWLVTKAAGALIGEDYATSFDSSLKADDFVFALRRAVAADTRAKDASNLFCIKNAEKINSGKLSPEKLGVRKAGDKALVIELEYPNDDFLLALTKPIAMPCNEEFFELTGGRYGLMAKYLIYNGPFYISAWYDGASLRIRKNENYCGDHTATASSVFFSVNSEFDTRGAKLIKNTYDFTSLDYSQVCSVENEKGVSVSSKTNTVWALVFNCKDSVMSDINARKAVCSGLDSSVMEKSGYMTAAAEGIVPESCVCGLKNYRESAGRVSVPVCDKKKASFYWNKTLERLKTNGISITIKCTAEHENQLRAVIQDLQKIFGISCDARVEVVEERKLVSDVESGAYQIAYAPLKAESDFALDFLCKYIPDITGYEPTSYKSVGLKARRSNGETKTKTLLKLENSLIENAVVYPMFSSQSFTASANGVSGIFADFSSVAFSFYNALKFL